MIPEILKSNDIQFFTVKADKPERLKSERAIVHFISTPQLDRQRDVMNPRGMDDKEFSNSPSVWYNHNYHYDPSALPIGKSLWRKKQDEGVLAKTQFATTLLADEVYTLHESDFMNTWSIGFRPVKDKNGVIEKDSIVFDEAKNITTWNKWNLIEYSSAPIAANVNALDQVKQLQEMNFKSHEIVEMVKSVSLEVEIKSKMELMQSELNELKSLKELLNELIEKTETNEKDILEVSNLLQQKENTVVKNISIELPGNNLTNDRIKAIAKRVAGGK